MWGVSDNWLPGSQVHAVFSTPSNVQRWEDFVMPTFTDHFGHVWQLVSLGLGPGAALVALCRLSRLQAILPEHEALLAS